jgi:hypothetical protein
MTSLTQEGRSLRSFRAPELGTWGVRFVKLGGDHEGAIREFS